MKRVVFPNPLGIKRSTKRDVTKAQRALGFPDAFAKFLVEQGGLWFVKFVKAKGHDAYLEDVGAVKSRELGPDLAELFDLERATSAVRRLGPLALYFTPIGKTYGGDPYVLIRRGTYAGFVASIAHGARPHQDIAGFDDATPDERSDLLAAPELDFLALHAPSLDAFLEHGVLIDDEGRGRVRNASMLLKTKALPKRRAIAKAPSTAKPESGPAKPTKAKLTSGDRKYLEERYAAPDVLAFYASLSAKDVTFRKVTLHSLAGLRVVAKTKHGDTMAVHRWPVIASTSKHVYLIMRDLGAYCVTRAPIAKISANKTKGQLTASFVKEPKFATIADFAAAFAAGALPEQK